MKRFFIFLQLCLLSLQLHAYNSYYILDVNSWWWEQQGSYDNVYLTVAPSGIYAECELIIDFTAENLSFNSLDSLEVLLNFELPENSVVTDLWLWIYGLPEQGTIHDRWTASLIYESIVQRRIDPALLTKNWNNTYELRVFPIMLDMPRRVKITYLTPIENSVHGLSSVQIPMNIINLSVEDPENVNIYFEGNNDFHSPFIGELPDKGFSTISHPEGSTKHGVEIAGNISDISNLNLNFKNNNNPIQTCVYADTVTEEKYFQVGLIPGEIFDIDNIKKAIFLIDYIDENCSSLTGGELLETLEESILSSFTKTDSINIFFSGIITAKASDNWIACDSLTITNFFNSLSADNFNSYSNLTPLITEGIKFLQSHSGEGKLVLISSGNENGGNQEANEIVTDVVKLIGDDNITIHTLNLDDKYYNYNERHYIGGNYYSGNEYLYAHLAQSTLGESLSISDLTLNSMLKETNARLSGHFSNMVVQLEFDGGYAYSVYDLNPVSSIIYFETPYQIIGKYIGDAPITAKSYAQLPSGEVIQNQTIITSNDLLEPNSTLSQIWAKEYINDLMENENSNLITNSIIETSIEKRVLCEYTAFLVLEPGFVPDIETPEIINFEIFDAVTSNRPDINEGNTLNVYPNPLSINSSVDYQIKEPGYVELKIVDIHGKDIEVLVNGFRNSGSYTIHFDGTNLPEGIYFCNLVLENKLVKQIKIISLK